MTVLSETSWQWCEDMLPRVSRTFALCIRFLPEEVRRPVLLSYLLCRVADTVEDAPELTPIIKRELLDLFASALGDPTVNLTPFATALPGRRDADAELAVHADLVILGSEGEVIREEGAWAYSDFAVEFEGEQWGWTLTYLLAHPQRGHFIDANVMSRLSRPNPARRHG